MMRTIVCRCVALGIGVASVAGAQTPAQPLQLADRGPAFYEVGVPDGARVDAQYAAVLTQRILLRLHDATIPEALVVIGEQAGLRFTYDQTLVPANAHVSLRADDIAVAAALTQVLLDANLDVELTPTGLTSLVPRTRRPGAAKQQAGTVTGRITDATTHRPIAYATVAVEDTRWGATANDSGVYHISGLPSGTYTLLGRSLGYLLTRHTTTVDPSQSLTIDFALEKSPSQLDQVVVTGTVIPTEVKALPTPISIISDSDITQQHVTDFQALIRQAVPSAVGWDEATYPTATTFSLRGASTLDPGSEQTKILVDGIETAYQATSQVDPASIDHIEVIRGPEAAAIYGSDAIGGVIQIFTKHGGSDSDRPQVGAQVQLSDMQTPYAGFRDVLRQQYSATLRGGAGTLGYNLGGGYARTANYLPNGEQSAQSNPSVYGGMHYVQGIATIDLFGRYNDWEDPTALNPALAQTGISFFSKPLFWPLDYVARTIGAHVALAPAAWWTSSLALGTDEMTIDQNQSRPRLTSPADTELSVEGHDWRRIVVAFNTTVRGSIAHGMVGSVTVGIDHYAQQTAAWSTTGALATFGNILTDPSNPVAASRTITYNTGEFVQGQIGLADALFVTAAMRVEQNSDFGDSLSSPISPRLGASYLWRAGDATIKLRGSYGTGIRPPDPGNKLAIQRVTEIVLANTSLAPERQSGGDGGADIEFGRHGSVGVTYYNQVAKNLIAFVPIATAGGSIPTYQNQNVGRVHNTGVEFEATAILGRAQLKAQYAYARARVDQLGPQYTGDQHIGDQVFVTPSRTGGASAVVGLFHGTTVTGGVTYVGSWQTYDFLAEFGCFGGTAPCPSPLTTRAFIKSYPAFAKARLSVAQQVGRMVSVFAVLDNLTNSYASEQTNEYPVVGRISSLGLRVNY